MNITTANDLTPNNEYYVCLIYKGRTFRSLYLGCVKTQFEPVFYFKALERNGFKGGIAFFGLDEIGVGNTRDEARANYGKLKNELPTIFCHDHAQIPGLENHPEHRK